MMLPMAPAPKIRYRGISDLCFPRQVPSSGGLNVPNISGLASRIPSLHYKRIESGFPIEKTEWIFQNTELNSSFIFAADRQIRSIRQVNHPAFFFLCQTEAV
jgi:hypothetical protein